MGFTQCEINKQIFSMKMCSSALAVKYVNAVRYGYLEKSEKLFAQLMLLKSSIRIFEEYELSSNVFAENSILNRFNKKALLSKDNSLFLESKNEKVCIPEEELNCFSNEKLCELAGKLSSICSTC